MSATPRPENSCVHEFRCCECERDVVLFAPAKPAFGLCMLCVAMPGWSADPYLVSRLDPDRAEREAR